MKFAERWVPSTRIENHCSIFNQKIEKTFTEWQGKWKWKQIWANKLQHHDRLKIWNSPFYVLSTALIFPLRKNNKFAQQITEELLEKAVCSEDGEGVNDEGDDDQENKRFGAAKIGSVAFPEGCVFTWLLNASLMLLYCPSTKNRSKTHSLFLSLHFCLQIFILIIQDYL